MRMEIKELSNTKLKMELNRIAVEPLEQMTFLLFVAWLSFHLYVEIIIDGRRLLLRRSMQKIL